jgi:hypothetical protein
VVKLKAVAARRRPTCWKITRLAQHSRPSEARVTTRLDDCFPLIHAAFLFCPSLSRLPPIGIIRASSTALLRGSLAQARAAPPLQRSFCVYPLAIAKSPARSPDIVEYRRLVFQRPRQHRAAITTAMSSSEDDTPLVRAKDQGEFSYHLHRKTRVLRVLRVLRSRDEPFTRPRPRSLSSASQSRKPLHQPLSSTSTLSSAHHD